LASTSARTRTCAGQFAQLQPPTAGKALILVGSKLNAQALLFTRGGGRGVGGKLCQGFGFFRFAQPDKHRRAIAECHHIAVPLAKAEGRGGNDPALPGAIDRKSVPQQNSMSRYHAFDHIEGRISDKYSL
jgi:hypothetical protein